MEKMMNFSDQCEAYALLEMGYPYSAVSSVTDIPIATLKSWKQGARLSNKALHIERNALGKEAFRAKYVTQLKIDSAIRATNESASKKAFANVVGTPHKRTRAQKEADLRKILASWRGQR
jgi:hypothetical protein